jgi:hypothetical protein
MCKRLTMLAKESATRYIAQCEHGTIHFVWDNLSIRLRPADFARLAEYVCTRASNPFDQGEPGEPDENKGVELKMRAIGIRFSPETLVILRDLMCLAVLQMEKPEKAYGESRTMDIAPGDLPWAAPSFCLN